MSLGTKYDDESLFVLCNDLSNKGVILVSAFENSGAVSYPAAYHNVIGVDASYRCIHADDFVLVENSIVNIRAKGGNQRVAWFNPSYTINQGASFAAAYVTAYIAKLLQSGVDRELVLTKIGEIAKYTYQNNDSFLESGCSEVFSIERAAVFPYNKEVHSLLNYSELLSMRLTNIFDARFSGNVGLKVRSIDNRTEYTIKNIDTIDYSDIDCMIISHVTELEGYAQRQFKSIILEQCLENGINVYSFDEYLVSQYKPRFSEKGLMLACPSVPNNMRFNKFGKLFSIQTPVLGVWGTSKQQGKYTLQLQIRRMLRNRNYKICQIGTEPSALLFGMDYCYSFGYMANNNLDSESEIEYLNYLMHELDIKKPDIILVGSQSGTVPMMYDNVGQTTIRQLSFLTGTKPDGVFLCVNLSDSLSYISRTISAIEGIARCKVIGIAIYPMVYTGWGIISNRKTLASNEEIRKFKEQLVQYADIPAFVIGNEQDEDIIMMSILNYFSKR